MSTEIGQRAESVAAEFLVREGFTILDRNWRTRWCEIDIVAHKAATVYFVEVKYRKQHRWGNGLDAITHRKLQQMQKAAHIWIAHYKWTGNQELAAVSLMGEPPEVEAFIERLDSY